MCRKTSCFLILVQLCHIFYHRTTILLKQRGYMHFVLPVNVNLKNKEGDIWRCTITGMWHCVTVWVVPHVFKDRRRFKQSKKISSQTVWPWIWWFYQPSRHQEPCTPNTVSHSRRLESSATRCENLQSRRVTFIVVFITCLRKDKYFLKLLRN